MTQQHSLEELSNHLKALEEKELGQYLDIREEKEKNHDLVALTSK
jgi:hypothetical protein